MRVRAASSVWSSNAPAGATHANARSARTALRARQGQGEDVTGGRDSLRAGRDDTVAEVGRTGSSVGSQHRASRRTGRPPVTAWPRTLGVPASTVDTRSKSTPDLVKPLAPRRPRRRARDETPPRARSRRRPRPSPRPASRGWRRTRTGRARPRDPRATPRLDVADDRQVPPVVERALRRTDRRDAGAELQVRSGQCVRLRRPVRAVRHPPVPVLLRGGPPRHPRSPAADRRSRGDVRTSREARGGRGRAGDGGAVPAGYRLAATTGAAESSAQRNRSTTVAIPCPMPMHIVASPISPSF